MSRHLGAAAACALAVAAVPASASALGVALSTSGWNWTNPAPQGNTLTGIVFTGNTGFAYGAGGTILRTDDGGTTWKGLATGTSAFVYDVDVVDANTIVGRVGGSKACSLRISTDGGQTFTRVVFDGEVANCDVGLESVDFVSKTNGFFLMDDDRVLTTTNGGASFGTATKVEGGRQIAFADTTNGFAITASTLKKTPDGGQTWSDVGPLPSGVSAFRLLGPTTLVAWGKDVLATSTDGGVTWAPHTLGGLDPQSVSCRTITQCVLYGGNKIVLTADGGATLTSAAIGNDDVRAVGYGSGTRLAAVGKRGVTYLSDDDGATFRRTSSDPVAESITSIDVRGGGGPVGITDNGRIARLSGDAWTLLPTISTGALADADFVDDKLGFALGANGKLQRTQDCGATWTTLDTGTPSPPSYVIAFDATTQALVGKFGVYRSGEGGVFGKITSKALRGFRASSLDAKGKRAAVSDPKVKGGGIRVTSDAGKTWRAVTLPKGSKRVTAVSVIPAKGLLATIDGRLYKSSTDGGKWTSLPAAGAQLEDLEAASSKEFYVVPRGGEWGTAIVLRSSDGGKSFAPQSLAGGGDGVNALAVDGPGKAYAAVFGGEAPALFSTSTGGVSGTPGSLSLSRTAAKQKAKNQATISGTLKGAVGGEEIRIAYRKKGSASWTSKTVIAGANSGSVTLRVKLTKGTYDVVAQWAGDSGRAGTGSAARSITLK
ncbi:MAG: hypothetical protein J7513_00960 [Solirubrobacteraceae bacterium]|nr:hypothetical protein [Solirubrobacteraceae bacterium]